jgi:dipeptidyl aminopeptidase/acylaminoacyl peptidase
VLRVSRRCLNSTLTVIFLLATAPSGAAQDIKAGRRTVTVSDAIEMSVWADPQYFADGSPGGRVGLFSPKGDQFIVVVRRGNLKVNTNEYSLLLFRTKDAFNNPKPKILATMSSSSNRDGIGNLKWLSDNETVVFLGENPGTMPAVYSLNVKTKRLQKLTHHATPVVAYDMSSNGKSLVFEAVPRRIATSTTRVAKRNGVVIATQSPSDLFLSEYREDQQLDRADRELFFERIPGAVTRVPVADALSEYLPLSVSPDGRYAVLETYAADVPASWSAYRDSLLHPYIVEPKVQGRRSNVNHYMLLDTTSGKICPLLDAPNSWFNNALAWSSDGNSLLLSGTYLPLDVGSAAERESRETHPFVVEIELPSKAIIPITGERLKISDWNERAGFLVLAGEDNQDIAPKVFKKVGSVWHDVPLPTNGPNPNIPIEVSLEENSNTRPKIFVTSRKDNRRALLFDLNPQFSEVTFGRVEAVTWKAADGHEVFGGLYYPPKYELGRRYPLVIQTHGFQKDRFWIDGPWSSAFAAQPLAAKDILVLQVGSSVDRNETRRVRNTPSELSSEMAAYEGAIDYLEGRGLIDRTRVGIIGFSRTVSYVAYTLTHSKYNFAAATMADGFDAGYVNLMLWGGTDYIQANGGLPFGSSLSSWTQNSPGFNLDKVNAPVRLEYYGWGGFLGGWQTFSGLSLLKKPVDFVWLPYGTHLLVKPWERLVSQQGNVDWFNFWLNGVNDSDPSKAAEYERWEQLRSKIPAAH